MLSIQAVQPHQITALATLGRRTFSEAFYHLNTPADIEHYLDHAFAKAQIAAQYNNPNCHFFFATIKGQTVGYLKLNTDTAQTEFQDKEGLEIERIYIISGQQGKGYGHQLLEFAENYAHKLDKTYIWLGVWEFNPKAIALYERFGLSKFDTHIYYIGNDAQTDYLMRKYV